jgi:hypothetical protein
MLSGSPNSVPSAKKCIAQNALMTGWQEIKHVPNADKTLRTKKSQGLLKITWKNRQSTVKLPAATQLLDILMQPLILQITKPSSAFYNAVMKIS